MYIPQDTQYSNHKNSGSICQKGGSDFEMHEIKLGESETEPLCPDHTHSLDWIHVILNRWNLSYFTGVYFLRVSMQRRICDLSAVNLLMIM